MEKNKADAATKLVYTNEPSIVCNWSEQALRIDKHRFCHYIDDK